MAKKAKKVAKTSKKLSKADKPTAKFKAVRGELKMLKRVHRTAIRVLDKEHKSVLREEVGRRKNVEKALRKTLSRFGKVQKIASSV